MSLVVWDSSAHETEGQDPNNLSTRQMVLASDSIFQSSPPQVPITISSNIDFPPLPQLNTYENNLRPIQICNMNDSSSDPLSGPSTLGKRQVSFDPAQNPTSPEHTNKKRIVISPDIAEEDNFDDDMSDIVANAPRLSSSIYANACPDMQSQQNIPSGQAQKQHVQINHKESLIKPVSTEVKEELYQARDHIIKAYNVSKDRNEQNRLLDLLDIFREFTNKGLLNKASNIIASQVANIETATRQIETKARDFNKIIAPAVPNIPKQQQQHQPQNPSLASVAMNGVENASKMQEWTTVGKKTTPSQARMTHASQQKIKDTRRLILIQDPMQLIDISPLDIRNRINKAFADNNIKGPVVNLIARTKNNNICISTTTDYNAEFLLEKKTIWENVVPHVAVQKDEPWYKVVAHGIPLADFNHEDGMEMIKQEVITFNKGLRPIGMPHWISTMENRAIKNAGSVAIAFATEQEANRAIQHRLYIAGISVRVTKYYTVAPTTQCQKCQGYGHLDSYCRRQATCALCGESHSTQQHYCSICKTKGKACNHLAARCANCKGKHQASSKTCEIYIALKTKDSDVID